MKIVVDANVVISAAITSGRTREVLCLSDAVFLAPPELEQEVSDYTPLIAEKSGLSRPEVDKTIDILFQSIGTVSYSIPSKDIRKARNAIGNVDPKDVPYIATAIAVDGAAIWSDDSDFGEQRVVQWHTTADILDLFDEGFLTND